MTFGNYLFDKSIDVENAIFELNNGTLKRADIRKVIAALGRIVWENAFENQPTRLRGLGVFGVYSYWIQLDTSRTRYGNGNAQRGKSTYTENKVFQAGANRIKLLFKPTKKFMERFV